MDYEERKHEYLKAHYEPVIFYGLRDPITAIRVNSLISHYDVSLWINHGLSGSLRVPAENLRDFLIALSDPEELGFYADYGSVWARDYNKDQVIEEDGTLQNLNDIPEPENERA